MTRVDRISAIERENMSDKVDQTILKWFGDVEIPSKRVNSFEAERLETGLHLCGLMLSLGHAMQGRWMETSGETFIMV